MPCHSPIASLPQTPNAFNKQKMAKHVEIIAGGVADELFRAGLVNDRNMFSASALVHPQRHGLVVQAHEAFLRAGASLLLTSNACVTPGRGFTVEEIREFTRLAGRLAMEARDRVGSDRAVRIGGSLPPLMPSFRSDRTIERQRGLDTYLLIGEALWPFVDVYVAETMSSVAEATMAFEAVESLQKPVMISFALNSTGELRSGEPVVESIRRLLAFCDERANEQATTTAPSSSNHDGGSSASASLLQGVLFNCSQPEDVTKALRHVHDAKDLIEELTARGIQIGGFADRISPVSRAGLLEEKLVSGAMHSAVDMEIFASFVLRWVQDSGATIVGGCCGVRPSYVERICERLRDLDLVSP